MKINLIKWRLMLTTLPITLLMLAAKMGLLYGFGFEGLVKFSDIGLVVTGGIFLIGFMLAGVMADYKESEKLPAELACALENIDDTIVLAYGFKPNFDVRELRRQIVGLTESMISWFERNVSDDVVYQNINNLSAIALVMEKSAVGPIISGMTGSQNTLRKIFTRITVIKRTNFLATGYALMEVLSVVILALLLVAKFENDFISGVIVCFITQIFVYMIRLIRDIDQPFEYSSTGVAHAADIDLFPLLEFYRRLQARTV